MAAEFRAEGIVDLLKDRDLSGKRICLPRARGARPVLVEALRNGGAIVDEIMIYDTIIPGDANPGTFAAALDAVDVAADDEIGPGSSAEHRGLPEVLGGGVVGEGDGVAPGVG